jgi:hypothetical protein
MPREPGRFLNDSMTILRWGPRAARTREPQPAKLESSPKSSPGTFCFGKLGSDRPIQLVRDTGEKALGFKLNTPPYPQNNLPKSLALEAADNLQLT